MDVIKFTINGKKYCAGSDADVAPDTTLNDYIRLRAELRGTKAMCHEGGCGACIVAVTSAHPQTKEIHTFSVNSCLVSVLSCHGWDVTTVEGVGGKRIGYHPIQERLASYNGSQCGFCSSGWVMSMYSLFEGQKHNLTMKEIENSFGSNICRCTGYRPILDAFKSLAADSPLPLLSDIEDIKVCRKSGTICDHTCTDVDHDSGWCKFSLGQDIFKTLKMEPDFLKIKLEGHTWFKVFDLNSVFHILDHEGNDSYMLIAGNTGQGVYPLATYPRVLIDITSVDELRVVDVDVNLVLGAGVSLSDVLAEFERLSNAEDDFAYLGELARHLELVAHVPVRNIGTIGGNLALKHQHNEFPSDVFLLLETVGAFVTLREKDNKLSELTMMEFLTSSLAGKVILNVKLPPLARCCLLKTYKVMPRAQNAHAHVSAGIMLNLEPTGRIRHATLVYAGVAPDFVHAENAERVLAGRIPFEEDVLALALSTLSEELFPNYSPPDPSPLYRKKLAVALFYKAIISMCPLGRIAPHVISGGEALHTRRPLSRGQQSFESDRNTWPLGRPLPRLDALAQCSGEARYADDLPRLPHELHAALVLTNVATGTIDKIDAAEALALPGVVRVFTSHDIPGTNAFTRADLPLQGAAEEVLCSGRVLYHAQPVAVIVAESHKLAVRAALHVHVTYKESHTKPLLTIREALKEPASEMRVKETGTTEPQARGTDVRRLVRGSYDIYGQYHYYMEPQTCVAEPHEDGLRLHSATQWMDGTQVVVASMLDVPESSIDVTVRRIGGAFGGKLTRSAQVAGAAALAATRLLAPVRLVLPVRTNMAAIGKRPPCSCDYEVGVNDDGEIQYLINTFYDDEGCSFNEDVSSFALDGFNNCYDVTRWKVSANIVRTDTPSNTWARAPGDCEGIAMIEHIMEHIAFEVKKDATEVRLANMSKDNNPIPELIEILKKDAEYDRRLLEVKKFNSENRWIKRGIKIFPMRFPLPFYGNFSALVSIFHGDGTVGVTHGGIEMGQGVHTKVAQVCAHTLGVPLESVSIKSSNTMTSPNDIFSGSSFVSELCAFAVMKSCEILLDRLGPVRKKLKNPTWSDIIKTAYDDGINLQSNYMYSKNDDLKDYEIYGVTIAEVEVDILTGSHQILRVDILEDTGKSMNPELDVGQVEGAFMMGVGYWTSEQLVYARGGESGDAAAGALLTDRTWTYKPPGMRDIPVDMRVYFRRNSNNATGVLGSKSAGEPPLCMAAVVPHAIRAALAAARADAGMPDTFFHIEYPYTTENIMLAAETTLGEMKLS